MDPDEEIRADIIRQMQQMQAQQEARAFDTMMRLQYDRVIGGSQFPPLPQPEVQLVEGAGTMWDEIGLDKAVAQE